MLLLAVVFVAAVPFYGAAIQPLDYTLKMLFQMYLFVVIGIYFIWCWAKTGQTLPMKTWRLRVITVDGHPLSPSHAVLRYSLAWASFLTAGIGFFWAFADKDRQFLHDRLARTKIVGCEA